MVLYLRKKIFINLWIFMDKLNERIFEKIEVQKLNFTYIKRYLKKK